MRLFNLVLLFVTVTIGYSQTNSNKMRMVDFSPKSKAYNIYYPSTYLVTEDEDIVTFTNAESGLNITISTYDFSTKIQEDKILEVLSGFVTDIKKSDWKSYQSKFDNLIEGRIAKKNDNWIWWGISLNKRAVFISINKANAINDDDIKLMRFIIEKLEIH